MNSRAQVSIEYLLLALFGIILATVAAILVDGVGSVAQTAQARVLEYRSKTIASLLQA